MTKKTHQKILIIVFCAFIAVIGILYVFLPKNDYSATEKRYLSQFPSVTLKNIADGSFSTDFEKFLADQTPFRTFFVSVNAYFELIKGNNGSNGVYLGKDGWLIEKPFARENNLEKNLKRIKNFANETDLPVYLMAIPSKGYIYSDKLPDNSMKYYDSEYLETINSILGDSVTNIDVSKALISNRNSANLFYKTDHHWTSDGAYIAYEEFCKVKGFPAPSLNNYDVEESTAFYGTSYSTSCYTLTKPDVVKILKNKQTKGNADVTIIEGNKKTNYDNMFFQNRLNEEDKYTVFLDGNHSRVDIKTGNNGGKLLLIKDSFAHCLAPFLAEQYSEIIMVDLRYYKKDLKDIIKDEKITEILFLFSVENLATSKDIIFD
jgi:hypothetical protein